MDEPMGFDADTSLDNLRFLTPEDYHRNEIKLNNKVAERHGGTSKVYVGEIIARREVFKELSLYVMITFPVSDAGFTGTQQVEGHLKLNSLVELAAVAKLCNCGKTMVIDRTTKEILEVIT